MEVSKRNSEKWLNPIKIIAKVILLTFIVMIVMGISAGIVGVGSDGLVENASQIVGITLFVCFMQTVALSYPIIHSKLGGWRLAILIIGVFFGISTFLVQIETLIFLDYFIGILNPELIPQLFLQGAITSVIFTPIAVFILRGWKINGQVGLSSIKLGMSRIQGFVKIALLSATFVLFYIFFGIFVAWQNPALCEYYGDLITQMAEVGNLMVLLQAGRAVIFVALALPVVQTMSGKTWQKGLAIALLFSILTSSNLLIPITIMPDTVRISHFIEVAIPTFIFGWLVVWLMQRSHKSVRDLFSRTDEEKQEIDELFQASTVVTS